MRAPLLLFVALALVTALVLIVSHDAGPKALDSSRASQNTADVDHDIVGVAPLDAAPSPKRAPVRTAEEAAEVLTGGSDEGVPQKAPAGTLTVCVVDEAGATVGGVEVDLEIRFPAGSGRNVLGSAVSRASDGVATIGLETLGWEPDVAEALKAMSPFYVVRAKRAQSSSALTRLASEPSDGSTVDLVVAAGGTMLVRVLTINGGPAPPGATVFGWWSTPQEVERDRTESGDNEGLRSAPVVDGIARLEGIGPGLMIKLGPRAEGMQPISSDWIPGPVRAGETIRAEVRLGPELATLRGQLLGLDGEPFANERLSLNLRYGVDVVGKPLVHTSNLFVSTNESGAFTFQRRPMERAESWSVDIVPKTGDPWPNATGNDIPAGAPEWTVAHVDLPRTLAAGADVDLGEIQLAPVPIVASGVVVDEFGAPAEAAGIAAYAAWGASWSERKLFSTGSNRSAPDGSFQVRAVRAYPQICLNVSKKGFK